MAAVFYLLIFALMIVSWWKIFEKAGRPGWASIIPIYNLIVGFQIIGQPVWWILLLLVPVVNVVIVFLANLELARRFGQDAGFAVGLFFLGIVFLPLLAFGDYQYHAPEPQRANWT